MFQKRQMSVDMFQAYTDDSREGLGTNLKPDLRFDV